MGSSQQHPGSLDPAAPLAVDAAALLQQVAASHQQQAGMDAGQEAGRGGAAAPAAPPRAGNRPARAASEPRPATSYNARHQQAEARRRLRINERLEALRQLVPHTERANTANFLEEVVAYVQRMQARVAELEQRLGMQPSVPVSAKPITFADDTPEATQTALHNDRRATQSLPQPSLLQLSQLSQLSSGVQQAAPLLPLPLGGQAPPADHAVQAAALALLQQHAAAAAQQQQQQQFQLLQQQLLLHQQQQQQQVAAAAASVGLIQPPQSFMLNPLALQQQSSQQQGSALAASMAMLSGQPSVPQGVPQLPAGSGDSRRQSLQVLAAADSLGALSAGDASLRSVSVPSRVPPQPQDEPPGGRRGAGGGGEQAEAHGIPTDEELAQLHEELTSHQDKKRPRLMNGK